MLSIYNANTAKYSTVSGFDGLFVFSCWVIHLLVRQTIIITKLLLITGSVVNEHWTTYYAIDSSNVGTRWGQPIRTFERGNVI